VRIFLKIIYTGLLLKERNKEKEKMKDDEKNIN